MPSWLSWAVGSFGDDLDGHEWVDGDAKGRMRCQAEEYEMRGMSRTKES